MSIKHLLREAGLKQADLAKALGVSEPTLSRWAHKGIPGDEVARVAKATGIPAARLRPDLAAAFGVQHHEAPTEADGPELSRIPS